MISVVEIEKNILDLRYQSELQKFNAYLIAITTGVIGFIATFLWFPEKFITGTIISLLLFIVFLALIKSSLTTFGLCKPQLSSCG